MVRRLLCLLFVFAASALSADGISVIVFDFGGVLGRTDRAMVVDYISASLEVSEMEARTILLEWFSQLEATPVGKATLDVANNATDKPIPPEWNAEMEAILKQAIQPIPGMTELVAAIRKEGYQTAILSNTVAVRAHAIGQRGFYKSFRPVVLSFQIGHSKPDPLAFRTFLNQLGRPASECLFIDDKESNIEAARKIGMKAIHFTSLEQLRADLIELGILLGGQDDPVLSWISNALLEAEISLSPSGAAPQKLRGAAAPHLYW